MNKLPLAVAACFLMAAGLAGCSSDKTPPPPPPAPPPLAAPAPPPPPPPPPPQYKSAQQQRVAQLQTALNANGAHLDVDGRMGSATTAALKEFQAQHHLKPTGRPDSATVKALGG
jgi:peptidoglycan hydrolase-like protein with peptidoglycan-binding domain